MEHVNAGSMRSIIGRAWKATDDHVQRALVVMDVTQIRRKFRCGLRRAKKENVHFVLPGLGRLHDENDFILCLLIAADRGDREYFVSFVRDFERAIDNFIRDMRKTRV